MRIVAAAGYLVFVAVVAVFGLSMFAGSRTERNIRRNGETSSALIWRADARAQAAGFERNPCLPPSLPATRHSDGSISVPLVGIDGDELVRCSAARGYLTRREFVAWQDIGEARPSRLFPAEWQIVPTAPSVGVWLVLVALAVAVPFARMWQRFHPRRLRPPAAPAA